jgi:Lrp/AsnC family transcriptional regulator
MIHDIVGIMDTTDRKILDILQQDAALSLDDFSERVGLSRNACWRRIKRLEDEGIIKARVTLLDASRINVGLTAFIALRTTEHSAKWLDQFSKAVRGIPEIIGVYRMTGDVDYLLQVVIPDVAAYDRLYKRLIGKITLADVSSSFVMEEIKSTTVLPLDYAPAERGAG